MTPAFDGPTTHAAPPLPTYQGAVRLTQYGVLRVHGADAATFLHGQLTQDFALLGMQEARLAAFCNAKGRMQASFVGFKHQPDDVLLIGSADLLAQTLKRLRMFVLRAQATLSDASADWAVWGVVGDDIPASLPVAPWQRMTQGDTTWIRLHPAAGMPRALVCQPTQAPPPGSAALSADVWSWLEVHSAVALVTQPLFEALVPQMLNYESVGGVNFKKGCYPGQEVVARSQFRGTLKRRTYVAHSESASVAEASAGAELFHTADPEQPCGLVVQSAPVPGGVGVDLLVSITTSAADGQALRLGHANGPELTLRDLPYALLNDI